MRPARSTSSRAAQDARWQVHPEIDVEEMRRAKDRLERIAEPSSCIARRRVGEIVTLKDGLEGGTRAIVYWARDEERSVDLRTRSKA